MLKKTFELLRNLFGFKTSDLETRIEADVSLNTTVLVSVNDLRYSELYQHHVFVPTIRAKEIAIHLNNKYGENWKDHVEEIHGEDEEVIEELRRIDLEKPVVSITRDHVPVVFNGFHTVCAYKNLGYDKISVALYVPHQKFSYELSLRTFDELTIYHTRR